MLSVVLYGRNDAHGYNLHKRGALSLNCIAEVLTDDDDELIFVDYNTPDELPTFPEALADTLTDQAKRRLRVIRVRGDYHRQFADKTRLVALECQSRNIAIRRSNPRNRWILSTNTDMIFCPQTTDGGLSAVVAGLNDAYYHLPRFEVPEGFWERLDRLDPRAAIEAMRRDGRRFHLNEIVYGLYDNLYEGPGDFQLFLREDLFDIQGFDERMIMGWHADANMARRMRLKRGEVSTAFPLVSGYHCGHTRQATSLHKGVRTENSAALFVRDVAEPGAPWQADSWGAPDWTFEEVRLDAADPYFYALAKATTTEGPGFSEASIAEGTYHTVAYDPEHVLPHLCDLLFNLPPGQTIFFFGSDAVLADGVRDFLEAAGRRPRFLLPQEMGSPHFGAETAERWASARVPTVTAFEEADLFLIQHPSADQGPPEQRSELEWWCHRVLTHLAEYERRRPRDLRRRTVVVNGVHNSLAPRVEAALAPTSMPFSTRLRQGFFIDPPAAAEITDAGLSEADHLLLSAAVADILRGADRKAWASLAYDLDRVCALEGGRQALGVGEADAGRLKAALDDALQDAQLRLTIPAVAVSPPERARTRLCGPADWRDPDWLELARTFFGPGVSDLDRQTRWTWERVSLIDNLVALHPPAKELFSAAAPARVLFVAETPDQLPTFLAYLGYPVRYATLDDILSGRAPDPEVWREQLTAAWLSAPVFHAPLNLATEGPLSFDVVMIVRSAWVEPGYDKTEALLQAIDPFVKRGALFTAVCTVELGEVTPYQGLSLKEWRSIFQADGALGSRGFTPIGGFDPETPLGTAVRFAPNDEPNPLPGLTFFNTNSDDCTAVCLACAAWPEVLRPGYPFRLSYITLIDQIVCDPLGRTSPVRVRDRQTLAELATVLARGDAPRGWERLSPELGSLAAGGPLIWDRYGLDAADAPVVLDKAAAAIREALPRAAVEPVAVEGRGDVGVRLCSGVDFEHLGWATTALRVFGQEAQSFAERKPWIWERTSLVHSLLPYARGEDLAEHLLVVTYAPDPIAHILAGLGFKVTAVTAAELAGEAADEAGWAAILSQAWLPPVHPVALWKDRPGDARFDGVVATQQTLLERDAEALDGLLGTIAVHLRPEARLHIAFDVQLNDGQLTGALTLGEWQGLFSAQGPLGARGFEPLGEIDPRVPLDTVVRFAPEGDTATAPGLSWGYGSSFVTVAMATAQWPAALKPGPRERLHREAERFDPALTPIPWGGSADLAGDSPHPLLSL
jgi:hypothetical protein